MLKLLRWLDRATRVQACAFCGAAISAGCACPRCHHEARKVEVQSEQ